MFSIKRVNRPWWWVQKFPCHVYYENTNESSFWQAFVHTDKFLQWIRKYPEPMYSLSNAPKNTSLWQTILVLFLSAIYSTGSESSLVGLVAPASVYGFNMTSWTCADTKLPPWSPPTASTWEASKNRSPSIACRTCD